MNTLMVYADEMLEQAQNPNNVNNIPANSVAVAQTKYGVIDPGHENSRASAQTKYGVICPNTNVNGHVMFNTPDDNRIVARKSALPEKVLDPNGNYNGNKLDVDLKLLKTPEQNNKQVYKRSGAELDK
jgi:hypothetical protein